MQIFISIKGRAARSELVIFLSDTIPACTHVCGKKTEINHILPLSRFISLNSYICCHLVVTLSSVSTCRIFFCCHALCRPKQIGFIMYGLHYTLLMSYMGLYVKPCSKSILQYPLTLGVTLPIRRGVGVRMYEWSRWMYCFNQKGTSCRHSVVALKVETWPIGLERIKTHPPVTFPLYYPPWYLINWEYSAAVTWEQVKLQLSSPPLLSDSFLSKTISWKEKPLSGRLVFCYVFGFWWRWCEICT